MDTLINAPSVSVIMPVYNCGSFIAESLESILDQTLVDFELIVIDDCSTDNTLQIINGYQDKRIRLITKNANSGYVDSLNTGIALSRGEFIARMDGDDISVRDRLQKQLMFLKNNPEVVLCGSWYKMLSSDEIIKLPIENDDIKLALLDYCAFGHPTVMLRRSFLMKYDLNYNVEFRPAEDYELWTKISAFGKMANIPEVLLYYRSHPNQVSNLEKEKQLSSTLICKRRMLCYPLNYVNNFDVRISAIVAGNKKIETAKLLEEVIDWLEKISDSNIHSCFFECNHFCTYITQKKASFIRTFYLNYTPYNPGVLVHFLKRKERFGTYFSLKERIRLTMKCFFFWNSSLMNGWRKS